MKKFALYTLLIATIIFLSCSSAKNPSTKNKSSNKSTVSTKGKKIVDSKIQKTPIKPRFSDTTVVVVPENPKKQKSSLEKQFEDALESFDKGNYDIAFEKNELFLETIAKGDSLEYESLFLKSECLIAKDEIDKAEKVLVTLYKTKNLPLIVQEKVLVRLGQVYCVQDKKPVAEKLFRKLKKLFPNSIYIPLANCEAVK